MLEIITAGRMESISWGTVSAPAPCTSPPSPPPKYLSSPPKYPSPCHSSPPSSYSQADNPAKVRFPARVLSDVGADSHGYYRRWSFDLPLDCYPS